MTKQKPVHHCKLGRIKASIWRNDSQNGSFYTVSVQRLYKDGDDWKWTESFSRDDLPLVAKVCDLAHTWIYNQSA